MEADSSETIPLYQAQTRDEFAANLASGEAGIEAVREGFGRSDAVRLLPMSKTVPSERIRFAIEAGATRRGENKVQEAAASG